MPSFRVAERWVRDASLPEAVRFLHFCYALESYVWLTGQSWSRTYARLGARLGFDWDRKPSGEQMQAALDALRLERERVKARRQEFRHERRAEKRRGRRQPGRAGLAQWQAIFTPDFLEFPHPDLPANVR
jgi:hypothetical protein